MFWHGWLWNLYYTDFVFKGRIADCENAHCVDASFTVLPRNSKHHQVLDLAIQIDKCLPLALAYQRQKATCPRRKPFLSKQSSKQSLTLFQNLHSSVADAVAPFWAGKRALCGAIRMTAVHVQNIQVQSCKDGNLVFTCQFHTPPQLALLSLLPLCGDDVPLWFCSWPQWLLGLVAAATFQ